MDEVYTVTIFLLPSWLVASLAFVAAIECLALSVYLIHTKDHLVMRAADVGIAGCFSALVGIHYIIILASPYYLRSVAISRVSWSLFFAANAIIMGRYIYAIIKRPQINEHC